MIAWTSFYVYLHRRADDGKVFYVGKGKGNRSKQESNRSQHWKNTKKKHGIIIEIVGLWVIEKLAFQHEELLISYYRKKNHPLCNQTNGGDGISGHKHSLETIKKLKSRKVSDEIKEKISRSHMGIKNSPETREKISAANKGRIRSPEFRAKIVAALTGRPCSAETRNKISQSNIGKKISQEHRSKISKALTGRIMPDDVREKVAAMVRTPEWRARHSAAMKGRPWSDARRASQAKQVQSF